MNINEIIAIRKAFASVKERQIKNILPDLTMEAKTWAVRLKPLKGSYDE